MKYAVSLSRETIKELSRLDTKLEQRLQKRFDELAADPFDPRLSHEVKMIPGQRYSRVGDRRLFFEIHESTRTLAIIAIRPRGRAYKKGK